MNDRRPDGSGAGPRFSLVRPSAARIRHFIRDQRELPFNYDGVGATRLMDSHRSDYMRGDFNVDQSRHHLGTGEGAFRQAARALKRWRQFDLGWVELCWPDTPICSGCAVAVVARIGRGWITNAARIAYVIDDTADQSERFGFAYGTLPGHAMRGEERFMVDWNRKTDEVCFDVLAMSKPNHLLTWASYPFVRRLQSRFRTQATAAMQRAIAI